MKYSIQVATLVFAVSFAIHTNCSSGEHAGKAAGEEKTAPAKVIEATPSPESTGGTKEHAGMEHPGEEHAGTSAKVFYAEDIKAAMLDHIEKVEKAGGGTFILIDKDDNNKELKLKFVKIHDPVRKIEGKGYFACTDFQVAGGSSDQLYDVDFWLNPEEDKLVVTDTKVHKDPVQEEGKWVKKARYTFQNDVPVPEKK